MMKNEENWRKIRKHEEVWSKTVKMMKIFFQKKKGENEENMWKMKKIMKKLRKWRTNEENEEKMRNHWRYLRFCLHTQNPPRFLSFAVVVVVTFYDEILDDFHDFFGMCCVFSVRKSTTTFGCLTVFQGKVAIFIGREINVVYPFLSCTSDDHPLLPSCLGTGMRVGS